MVILRTSRLYMRKIQTDDYSSVCSILQEIDVMYAWEHAIDITDSRKFAGVFSNVDTPTFLCLF